MNDYRDYLMHYGIKGMHWGMRRYQNKDGTLTELGKKRAMKEKNKEIRDLNRDYDAKLARLDFQDKFLNSKLMKNYKHKQKKLNANAKTREAIEQIRKKRDRVYRKNGLERFG